VNIPAQALDERLHRRATPRAWIEVELRDEIRQSRAAEKFLLNRNEPSLEIGHRTVYERR